MDFTQTTKCSRHIDTIYRTLHNSDDYIFYKKGALLRRPFPKLESDLLNDNELYSVGFHRVLQVMRPEVWIGFHAVKNTGIVFVNGFVLQMVDPVTGVFLHLL